MVTDRLSPTATAPTATEPTEAIPVLHLVVPVDAEEARHVLAATGEQFTRLVRQIPRGDTPSSDLKWTVAETAAHVLCTVRYYRECIEGKVQPEPVDDVIAAAQIHNDQLIAAEPERDPDALSSLIDKELEAFIEASRAADPSRPVFALFGYGLDLDAVICNGIGELLIHGRDIARSIDRPWQIDPHAARLAVYSTSATLPLAADPDAIADLDAVVNVRVRGGSCFAIRIRDGRASTEPCVSKPDLVMSIDPVAYLLVGFGRVGQWGPILRGALLAWGRRPALGFKLPKLFRNP